MGGSQSGFEEGWQLKMDLRARRRHLLTTELWANVQFKVGKNRNVIKAHREFLASASPVFEAMLYGPWIERNALVRVPDISPDTFNLMLEFIYTDTTDSVPLEKLPEIDYVSKKYMIPRLMKAYTDPFIKSLNLLNVVKYYEYAAAMEYQPFIDECEKIFSSHTKEILGAESSLHCDMETLKFIFSREQLSVQSEFELLDFTERYAQTHCFDIQNKGGDQRRSIRPLLQQIRFLSLTPGELSRQHHRLRDFLTESEILSLILNMGSEGVVPLPEGFSTNRNPRIMTERTNTVQSSCEVRETEIEDWSAE